MHDDDAEYYQDRKLAALAMSEAASDPAIRNIHRDLASRYGALTDAPAEKALDVVALDGNVEIIAPNGDVTSLTPQAAATTSDRLQVRVREADGQTAASIATPTQSLRPARSRLSLRASRQEKS